MMKVILIVATLLGVLFYSSVNYAKTPRMFDPTERTLFTEVSLSNKMTWVDIAPSERQAIRELLNTLTRSKTGKGLIAMAERKAFKQGTYLIDLISGGNGSICDTTLIRRFSPVDFSVVRYDSRSVIYLNRNLSVVDALMDLAHELTHYTLRTTFNPYEVNFTLKDFIRSTIEERGGEVDAFLVECQVQRELFSKEADKNFKCQNIRDSLGEYSKDKATRLFYRIGKNYAAFLKELQNEGIVQADFPMMSSEEALFISSDYSEPYPIAAVSEYQSIMSRACANDSKRLAMLGQKESGRTPASLEASVIRKSFETRCQKYPID